MPKKAPIIDYVKIDDERINIACEAYFKWKSLNDSVKNLSHRGINIPEAISEPIGCYCLDLLWNRGNVTGDATDPKTNNLIEFKATSNFDSDLSSFGPKTYFDDLVFLRFNQETNMLYVYDLHINAKDFVKLKANKNQTIEEQQQQKRRPHVSIINGIIEPNNLNPDVIFDIRRMKIVEDNR